MDTEARVTRSRAAKAIASTPAAAPPPDKHKFTPKAKTTSKKGGRGAVRDQPEVADPKAQLSFAAEDNVQAKQPSTPLQEEASSDIIVERSVDQLSLQPLYTTEASGPSLDEDEVMDEENAAAEQPPEELEEGQAEEQQGLPPASPLHVELAQDGAIPMSPIASPQQQAAAAGTPVAGTPIVAAVASPMLRTPATAAPSSPAIGSPMAASLAPSMAPTPATVAMQSPGPSITPTFGAASMTPLPPSSELPPAEPSPGFQFAAPYGAAGVQPAAALAESPAFVWGMPASGQSAPPTAPPGTSAQPSPYGAPPPPLSHLQMEFSPLPTPEALALAGAAAPPMASPSAWATPAIPGLSPALPGSLAPSAGASPAPSVMQGAFSPMPMGFGTPSASAKPTPMTTGGVKASAAKRTPKGLTVPCSPTLQTASRSVVKPASVLPLAASAAVTPAAAKTPAASSTPEQPRQPHFEAAVPAATSTPAAKTPVVPRFAAPAAAATAKSAKRVSIHTPVAPKSTAPSRMVVATPYPAPKPSRQATPEPEEALPQQQAAAPSPAAAFALPATPSQAAVPAPAMETQDNEAMEVEAEMDEDMAADSAAPPALASAKRSKAADRLKAIHDAEASQDLAAVPSYMQPTAASVVRKGRKLASKVEASGYDPRSMGELKREIAVVMAKKKTIRAKAEQQVVGVNDVRVNKLTPRSKGPIKEAGSDDDDNDVVHQSDDDQEEAEYDEAHESRLVAAMGTLEIAKPKAPVVALRGVAAPRGVHRRFDDEGAAKDSPQRVVLRGMPVATGSYKRWV